MNIFYKRPQRGRTKIDSNPKYGNNRRAVEQIIAISNVQPRCGCNY